MEKAIKDLKEARGFLLALQAMCVVNVDEPLKHISNAINSLIESEQLTKKQKDFLTWYTTGDNKHYVGDKLIEAYKKEVLNM